MKGTKTVGSKEIQAARPHRLVAEWWSEAQRVSMVCVRCRRQVISHDVPEALRSFAADTRCR